MSHATATAAFEAFLQAATDADADANMQTNTGGVETVEDLSLASTSNYHTMNLDGFPEEPGTASYAETAGFFGRIGKALFGKKNKKDKEKEKEKEKDTSARETTSALDDKDDLWADYIGAAKRNAEKTRARASYDSRVYTAMSANDGMMRQYGTFDGQTAVTSSKNAVFNFADDVRESADDTSATAEDTLTSVRALRFNDTAARKKEKSGHTMSHAVFNFDEDAELDRRIRERLGRRDTDSDEDDTMARAPSRSSTSVSASSSATTTADRTFDFPDFTEDAEFDMKMRERLAQKSSTSSKAPSWSASAASSTSERVVELARVDLSKKDYKKKPIRQVSNGTSVRSPLVADAYTPPRITRPSKAAIAAASDSVVDDMMGSSEGETSGLFRGIRDAITSTSDLKPLSAAQRSGLNIPLADVIEDKSKGSDALMAAVGNETLSSPDMIKISIDKTGRSLSMSIVGHHVKPSAGMEGRHYTGFSAQRLLKSEFFSKRKGVLDPARASISFLDPISQEQKTVNVRAVANMREQLMRDRAWFAALPTKKHVLVLRFGPDMDDRLEDVFVFYMSNAVDRSTLAQQDLKFASLIIDAAKSDKPIAPDSFTAAPVGVNAYTASIVLATALKHHRDDSGESFSAVEAGVKNQTASPAHSATFHAFNSHVQRLTDQMHRDGVDHEVAAAQQHGERFYEHLKTAADAAGVSSASLHKSLTQAWQASHLQATRGVAQHTAKRLDSFHRATNVTGVRAAEVIENFFA